MNTAAKMNLSEWDCGIFLYELHNCCTLAVIENKNLYLVEENSEYILER